MLMTKYSLNYKHLISPRENIIIFFFMVIERNVYVVIYNNCMCAIITKFYNN